MKTNRNIKIINAKERLYNFTIGFLCIVSLFLAIVDFSRGLNHIEYLLDCIIYGLFVADYFVRLLFSKQKLLFFKNNIIDLIAIIPFNSAFRALRLFKIARFLKLLKFSKLFRVGSFSARLFVKLRNFFNTNGFKYVLLVAIFSIFAASICMMYFEKMTFSDSLWWSFVTATTVGYGDLSPSTGMGRVITSILMIVGIGLIGSLTSSITSFFLDPLYKSESISSDKVNMIITMYDSLSEGEQELFKELIKRK